MINKVKKNFSLKDSKKINKSILDNTLKKDLIISNNNQINKNKQNSNDKKIYSSAYQSPKFNSGKFRDNNKKHCNYNFFFLNSI